MRRTIVICLAASLAALMALPAYAARDNVNVRGRVAISLGNFDIVIGDLGDRSASWNNSPTRVHVEVLEGRRTRDLYFDSLPAAFFVLREMYGAPRIVALDVPDFLGQGLIDGTQAYYVLDYEHYSRGGLPLVLAFNNYGDALDELQYRNGEVMGFDDLVAALDRWDDNDRDRIYWRGWDRDRWDSDRWNDAWNNRWRGWGWDNNHGWLRIDVGQDNDDWGRNRRDHDHYDRGRGDGDGRDRNRDDREQYDRRHDDRGRGDRARGDGDERDRDRDGRGEGDRARGDGREQDGGNGDQGQGDSARGDGNGRDNHQGNHGQENTDRHSGRVRNTGTQKVKDTAKGKVEANNGGTNRQSGRVR